MQEFDEDAIAQPAQAWKQPSEKLDRAVDFSDRLKSSASLASIAVNAFHLPDGAAASGIVASSPAPLIQTGTKIVQFRLQGGADGESYNIQVQATGDDGQVAEFDIELHVINFGLMQGS